MRKTILAFVGTSGSWKSTLEKKLVTNYSKMFDRVVSTTTRKMRKGEKEWFDYFYVEEKDFFKEEKVEFQKWGDTYYWFWIKQLEKLNKTPVLIVTIMPDWLQQAIDYIKNHNLDIDVKIVVFNISKKVTIDNMYKRLAEDTHRNRSDLTQDELDNIKNRIEKDNILEDFKKSWLKADFKFNNLSDSMDKELLNFLQICV